MAEIIQQRRDTAARWAQYNPVLLEGEVGYVTDNPNQYKIGDGIHAWNDLKFRGFDGTITQEKGNDENAVMSQKAVTKELSELASEAKMLKTGVVPLFSETKTKLTKLSLQSSALHSIMEFPFKKGKLYHVGVYSKDHFTTDNSLNLYSDAALTTSVSVINVGFDRNFIDGYFYFSFIAADNASCIGTWFNNTDNAKEIYCIVYEDKLEQGLEDKEQRLNKIENQISGKYDFVYKFGKPFYAKHECIVDFDFKKNSTYIVTITTEANLGPLYSIVEKDSLSLLDENIKKVKQGSTTTFEYKPLKDCIGIGSWVESDEYGKEVHISIKHIANSEPTYVIVDADICGDIDDLFAMRVLAQAEKQGKIVIVGINCCAKNEDTATGIDGFFCHEGIKDICIGIDREGSNSRSLFLDKCAQHYHTYSSNEECEDTLAFYKRALSFIPDNSKAIIITLGFFKSLRKVFSDTETNALVSQKINKVYCMGGNFIDSSYVEYNFQVSVSDTRTFVNDCPVPIYFVGFETCGNVMGGKCLGENGYTFDLMQIALQGFYREWGYTIERPMERNAPDAIACMIAIADDAPFYNCVAKRGKVSINDNGSCSFSQNNTSGSHYVVWVNNTEGYKYEQWTKTMEKKLSDIMLRTSEQYGGNIRRLPRMSAN